MAADGSELDLFQSGKFELAVEERTRADETEGERKIQRELDGTTQDEKVFQEIAQLLATHGYHYMFQQCRGNLEKLKSDYWAIKDHNDPEGQLLVAANVGQTRPRGGVFQHTCQGATVIAAAAPSARERAKMRQGIPLSPQHPPPIACSRGSVEFLCLVFTSPFLTTYPFSSCTLRSHHTCLYNAPSIPIIRPNVADTCWHLSMERALVKSSQPQDESKTPHSVPTQCRDRSQPSDENVHTVLCWWSLVRHFMNTEAAGKAQHRFFRLNESAMRDSPHTLTVLLSQGLNPAVAAAPAVQIGPDRLK
ncbi:hypothetical protein INR49_000475 [Caranx melampygus]|nr:hypothetical protein INR49_000475 [Caranx melampygus]